MKKAVIVLDAGTFYELVRVLFRLEEYSIEHPELLKTHDAYNKDIDITDLRKTVTGTNCYVLTDGFKDERLDRDDLLSIISALGNSNRDLTRRLMERYADLTAEVDDEEDAK